MEVNLSPQVEDEIFEALLKVAAKDAMQREMAVLPTLEELNEQYPPSEALNKKVYATFKKEARATQRKKMMRVFIRAAAVFCVFVVVSVGALMTVEASRNFIFNLLIEMRDGYVSIRFEENNVTTIDAESIINYLPDGFVLVESHRLEDFSILIYANENGDEIIVKYSTLTAFHGVDTELREFTSITLGGLEAFLFTAIYYHARNEIMWQQGDVIVNISTHLHVDELIRIAERFVTK